MTIGREKSNIKELEFFHHVDLVPAISSISSWLSLNSLLFSVETLMLQVISPPGDVTESSIGLLARRFEFEGGRLKRFEGRGVIRFFEFFILGVHEFALRLILH